MKSIFKTTYLKKFAAIAGLVLVASLLPTFTYSASAAPGASSPGVLGALINWSMPSVLQAIVEIVKFVNSYLVYVVAWAGGLMDTAINIAMAPLQGIGAIETGWRITRDVANVFFIFFLLTIAIATILRVEKYGAKALLAKLIIAAILINFSLVIAQVVVDASNILGITFVSKIHPVSDKIATVLEIGKLRSKGTGAPPKTATSFSVAPGTLSAVANQNTGFAKGEGIAPLNPVATNPLDLLVNELFYVLMIFIFQLLVVFVFLALAILFIIRTVALMIVFILAPLGFLFSVLPATQKYANEWWHSLFSWSFFFPASTFMLYIAISFGYELRNINFQGNQASNQGLAFATITMICLLMGSLIVARKMGIYGASAIMGYGNKLRGRAQGYLGKGLRYATVGAAGAGVGYAATKLSPTAGKIAERLNTNAFARTLAKPFARLQQAGAQGISAKEKRWEDIVGRGDSAFKAAYAATVTPTERAAARKIALKKDKGSLLSEDDLQREVARAKRDNDKKALQSIYKVNPKLAAAGEPDPVKQQTNINDAVGGLTAKDVEDKLDAKSLQDEMVQNALLIRAGEKEMEAAVKRFGSDFVKSADDAFTRLVAANGGDMTKAVDEMRAKNKGGLKYMATNPYTAATSSMVSSALANIEKRNKDGVNEMKRIAREAVISRGGTAEEVTAAEKNAEQNYKKIDIT